MREAIYRDEAVEALKEHCETKCLFRDDNWCPDCQYEEFKEIIANLPPAKPEIISCKNCRHYKYYEKNHYGWCEREDDCETGVEMEPDDYCSRFEMKRHRS